MNKFFSRKYLLRFSIYLIVGLILGFGALYTSYKEQVAVAQKKLEQDLIVNSTAKKVEFKTIEKHTISNLIILSENDYVRDFLYSKEDTASFYRSIRVFLTQNPMYQQMRFIDLEGKERFRVDNTDNHTRIIPEDKLQDKSGRYYFSETVKLGKNEIFVSDIDLNIENCEIEVPHRIMIRYATPVYNTEIVKIGIIVINVDLTSYFNTFRSNSTFETKYCVFNNQGYFLESPDTSLEFGFMFPDGADKTIQNKYPNYKDVLSQRSYFKYSDKNLLFYHDYYESVDELNHKIFTRNRESFGFHMVQNTRLEAFSFVDVMNMDLVIKIVILYLLLLVLVSYLFTKNEISKIEYRNQLIISNNNLSKTLDSQSKFFSILSHDLKNTLGGLYTLTEFISEELKNFSKDELFHNINLIKTSADQQYKLLVSILEWKRIEMGVSEVKKSKIELSLFFKNLNQLFLSRLENKNLKLEYEFEEGQTVCCDENSLNTIFRNLIDNAIKYSEPGGLIEVNAFRVKNTNYISVRDSGVGIPAKFARRIFDVTSNYRTSGTANEPSSGFGLKLVHSMVLQNNGTIKVESVEGKGTKFVISLPVDNCTEV